MLASASGNSVKICGHLLRRLQIELVAVIAKPLGVVHRLARADAEQDVVRLEIGVLQVVDVVRADQRQSQLAGNRQQAGLTIFLLLDALELHFEEEVAGTEMSR